MTTTYWVVDVEVEPDQAQECAVRVQRWLIQEGIVLPSRPQTTEASSMNFRRGSKVLLPPGPKALDWCAANEVFGSSSWVEIVTQKRVFDPGANFSDLIECSNCASRFDSGKLEWMTAIDGWWERDDGSLTCPACKTTNDIGQWRFPDSSWAFGYLGFGFNEWYVDERIMKAISSVLQHRCVFVWSHI
ncbi:hypothetical protein [Aquabacterium parvum]|uniref:hypothetical protein n=1 Tax=Aquabacterium parvum TaxID=70584 RepID=UPI000718FAC7|nr:hypothetical protein [Aquabacterium parvum]MBU0915568.1 hypothetical protein [Gammaproteobacteria bacterium]